MEFNDALLAKLLQTKGSGQKVSFFHSTHPASTPQTVHEDITSALADGRVDTLVLPAFRRTADTVRDEPDQAIVLQLVDDSDKTEDLVRSTLEQGGQVGPIADDVFEDNQPRAICRF